MLLKTTSLQKDNFKYKNYDKDFFYIANVF